MTKPDRPEDCLFFWGHTPKTPGVIDKSCLSQWYPSLFVYKGFCYQNAEQFMMHMKAKMFKDEETASLILKATTPKEMKDLGRQVKNFLEVDWIEFRELIVKRGTIEKFNQNPDLKKYLLSTSGKYLVEASPYDKIWGIGIDPEKAKKTPINQWKGLNLLGQILTEVREELK